MKATAIGIAFLVAHLAILTSAVAQTAAVDYLGRAIAKYKAGDFDGALADFNRAIVLHPKYAYAYNDRGNVKADKGDSDGAIADYSRAIDLHPKYAYAYYNRAIVKEEKGDPDGALADYNRAIELDLKDPNAYYGRGNVKKEKGDFNGALADYNRAIELDPKHLNAYCGRGNVKKEKGDFDGALADYNRAIELDPKDLSAYKARGAVRFMQRSWADSLADFERACELNPRDQDYARLYAWLTRSQLGKTATADKELADYAHKRWGGATGPWPSKIANFLLNRLGETDFLAAAASPDRHKQLDQPCEAWFFVGMKHLLGGDKPTAIDCFRKCLSTAKTTFYEYQFAKSELEVLER